MELPVKVAVGGMGEWVHRREGARTFGPSVFTVLIQGLSRPRDAQNKTDCGQAA